MRAHPASEFRLDLPVPYPHLCLALRRRNRRRMSRLRFDDCSEFEARRFPVEGGTGQRSDARREEAQSFGIADLEDDARLGHLRTALPLFDGDPLTHPARPGWCTMECGAGADIARKKRNLQPEPAPSEAPKLYYVIRKSEALRFGCPSRTATTVAPPARLPLES